MTTTRDIFDLIAQAEMAATLYADPAIVGERLEKANATLGRHIERVGAHRRMVEADAPASVHALAHAVSAFVATRTVKDLVRLISDAERDMEPGARYDLATGDLTEEASAADFRVHWGAFGSDSRGDTGRKVMSAERYAAQVDALPPLATASC